MKPAEVKAGIKVRIEGLRTAAALNGKVAFVDSWNEEIHRWNVRVLTTDENGEEIIQNKAFKAKFLRPTKGNIVLKAAVELINLHEEVKHLFPDQQQGYVIGYDEGRDRWKVRILPGDSFAYFAESNLKRIDSSKLSQIN